jgi:hypothetical protein
MNKLAWMIGLAASAALPLAAARAQAVMPLNLTLQIDPNESVYAPPEANEEQTAVNAGGVNFELRATYFTDYVFRGINRSESSGSDDSGNVQVDGAMRFDLGKFPDLFMGVFTNINDSDPISRFQEIRPYFGLELTARPLIFTFGNTFYIFPDRDQFNTSEVWAQLKLDDSYFFRTDNPILSPYVMCAWDYDKNNGFYVEAGVRHDFEIEDTPLVLSPIARVAYVSNYRAFRTEGAPGLDPGFESGTSGPDTGLQHYDIGLELTYGLNDLLDIPARYGTLDFKGYLFYTDGIDNKLRADTDLYGGVGVGFSY